MSASVIDVRDVCFAYGSQEALHNVTFSVPERAFVAVVGPNGGGKSTMLKLILGEMPPRYGVIRVLGRDPVDVRQRVGYVPQTLPFDPGFPVSVRDVVLMGRVDRTRVGPYRAADRLAAAEALARVGLDGFERRPFSALSGGERQRVLIAQALVSSPEILLLDEPTANIDPSFAGRLHSLFRELKKDRTVIMVSHNLVAVTEHATHVLCVNRTAEMHRMADVAAGTIQEGHLTVLMHGPECHVLDSSSVLDTPHSGASEIGRT